VASAGDVNGDGYADFLVGSYGASSGSGAAHVYLGSAIPNPTAWNGAAPTQRINLTNPAGASARFGSAVASAGDVNGDGYADFLVGAHDATSLAGAAQLYLGSATPSATAWNAAPSSGRSDLANPDGASARFGGAVARAKEVNGDEKVHASSVSARMGERPSYTLVRPTSIAMCAKCKGLEYTAITAEL
jgi:hypothetical protein